MEYKNLDNRILLWLVKERKEKGNDGSYRTSTLYQFYSDLPDEYITKEMKKYSSRGLFAFASGNNRRYLTDKGISLIHSFNSNDR